MSPIGVIHTPYKNSNGTPIQARANRHCDGSIEIFSEYADGLRDLEGFSHIILLYCFHKSEGYSLVVKPFLDTEKRGLFSTRAPRRPNPIGLSVVSLRSIQGNILHISGIDMLDNTPLLDIKPYVPQMDHDEGARIGWLEKSIDEMHEIMDDGRFGTDE